MNEDEGPIRPKGRADLLKLELDRMPADARTLSRAQLLGFDMPAEVLKKEPPTSKKPVSPPERYRRPVIVPSARMDVPFWQPSSLRLRAPAPQRQDDRPSASPSWDNRPDELPRFKPLASPDRLALRLAALLASRQPGRRVDARVLTNRLARLEQLDPLPRRQLSRTPPRIQVIADRSLHLTPIWADQTEFFRHAERILPHAELRPIVYEPALDAFTDPMAGGAPIQVDPRDGPALALSDLGAIGGEEKVWRRLGERFAEAGELAAAVLPCAASRLPRRLAALWRSTAWEEHTPSVDPREAAERLRALLSPAIRIEPELLRAVRLGLGRKAGVEAEIRFWNSRHVASQHSTAATFERVARDAFRDDLAKLADSDENAADVEMALGEIRRWRTELPEEIWFEEIIDLPEGPLRALIPAEDLRHAEAFWAMLGAATKDERQAELSASDRAWLRRVSRRVGARQHRADANPHLRQAVTAVWTHRPQDGPITRPGEGAPPLRKLGKVRALLHGGDLALDDGDGATGALLAQLPSEDGIVEIGEGRDFIPYRDRLRDGSADGPVMNFIPAGEFMMGAADDDPEAREAEKPPHPVSISQPFALSRDPVSRREFKAFCDATQTECPDFAEDNDNLPATHVSWRDARAYCRWLSEQTGRAYRLPSEAEWEYACRAGTKTPFYWGRDWRSDCANAEQDVERATEAGTYPPNPWGLFDMLGNLWEWCEDVGHPYVNPEERDMLYPPLKQAGDDAIYRVVRGGAWDCAAVLCRATARHWEGPETRKETLGFRVVLELDAASEGMRRSIPSEGDGGSSTPDDATGAPPLAEQKVSVPPKYELTRVTRGHPAALPLPPAPFVLRTDRAELVIQRLTLSDLGWAAGMGRDRYGLWADFTLRDVRQRCRWCPPGRFVMGSPKDEPGRWDDEGPLTEVVLEHGFWLFDTPVTQALYEAAGRKNESRFRSPDRPVESVTWRDAQEFCEAMNAEIPGLDLGLPSEARWEYACRAGTQTALWTGPIEILGKRNAPALDPIAWYGGNSGVGFDLDDGRDASDWEEKRHDFAKAGTRRVKGKACNPWGLYDMLGNVWEWCADDCSASHDGASPRGIARQASKQENRVPHRVLRGGSWHDEAGNCRSAARNRSTPEIRNVNFGFRPAPGQVRA